MSEPVRAPQPIVPSGKISAWAPLREPLFRTLWGAAVVSYLGTWMQNVGAGWLMTQLTMSPLMVGLVQAATMVPVFLVILPAGALADMVDRRQFLLITQGWMVVASGMLGVVTLRGHVTPWVLLGFTFALGLGSVMNDPAWQAITPEIVSPQNHAPAVALNSVGFNVARVFGPALGGMVITLAGSGTAFLLNALSFFGVIIFLYRWKRPHYETVAKGRVIDAIAAGYDYVKTSTVVKCVLVRTGSFSLAATALLALLPILASPYGATGYGLLLGFFGVGALAGAAALSLLRSRLSVDVLVTVAVIVFAGITFGAGQARSFSLLSAFLFVGGMAWIGILACLNVAAQTMSPSWMRARALSFYLLVLQGGMAIGSGAWGALATKYGVPRALIGSAIALLLGLVTVRRYPLSARELALAPAIVRD